MTVGRQLEKASDKLSAASERLASGMRINRASDDAAGLAISTSLNTSSRIFSQSIRNINDGISAASIAEGAITNLSSVITRLRELAEQAATGTLSSIQRSALDSEAQALRSEFNRTVATTKFNGITLIDERTGAIRIQAGDSSDNSALYLGSSNTGAWKFGDGSFTASASLAGFSGGNQTTAGDVNGDGIIDIIETGTPGAGRVAVYIGNGDGTFKASTTYEASSYTYKPFMYDFNGDGRIDLGVGTGSGINVLLGNSNGSFSAPRIYSGPDGAATFGDVNGDGIVDAIATDYIGKTLNFFHGNGDGSFRARVSYALALNPGQPNVVDVTGDGKLDLVYDVGNFAGVLVGNGDGSFAAPVTYSVAGLARTQGIADVNGDGYVDIAATIDDGTNGIVILLNNGNGTFRAPTSLYTGGRAFRVNATDINGDGAADLVASADSTNALFVMIGNGDGTFKARISVGVGGSPNGVLTLDLNDDGVIDIGSVNTTDGSMSILLGNGVDSSYLGIFSLRTVDDARIAMRRFMRTQDNLSLAMSKVGAAESRFQFAKSNLDSMISNYKSAESRIKDVDVAQETAEYMRAKIIQDVAASLLAQANQQPALTLLLLK